VEWECRLRFYLNDVLVKVRLKIKILKTVEKYNKKWKPAVRATLPRENLTVQAYKSGHCLRKLM